MKLHAKSAFSLALEQERWRETSNQDCRPAQNTTGSLLRRQGNIASTFFPRKFIALQTQITADEDFWIESIKPLQR